MTYLDRQQKLPRVDRARLTLRRDELAAVLALVDRVAGTFDVVDDGAFLSEIVPFAHELPVSLRRFLNRFRLADGPPPYCVISGFPVEDRTLAPTPAHWDARTGVSPTHREEIYLMLCAALVGDVFGWATQQGGYMVHDVLPIREFENGQMGVSSGAALEWHTEDAFHPYRADHVGLMCLRNPDETATTVGCLDLACLSESEIDCLFEPRFIIRADPSHKPEFKSQLNRSVGPRNAELEASYRELDRWEQCPEMVPILSGRRSDPFICADPIYAEVLPGDTTAAAALRAFGEAIDKNLVDLVLAPGDVLFVDNAKAVHGRKTFFARYDGTDRWLKRVNITMDLRKSAASRTGQLSRLIY